MPKRKKPRSSKESESPKPETATRTEEKVDTQPASSSEAAVDIAALPLWQTLQVFLGILDRVAWQRIGLVVNPMTQKVEKDIEQARIAIDCYEVLLKHLGDHIEADVKRHLETRLTDLKLNYSTHV